GLDLRYVGLRDPVLRRRRLAFYPGALRARLGGGGGLLLRPEVGRERVTIGLAARGARSGTGGLYTPFTLVAHILQDSRIGGDFRKNGIGIGKQPGIRRFGGFGQSFGVWLRLWHLGVVIALMADAIHVLFRLLRGEANRSRPVTQILQALPAGVAVDQSDRVEIGGHR